jgi:flagellar biogenesis protein FliO
MRAETSLSMDAHAVAAAKKTEPRLLMRILAFLQRLLRLGKRPARKLRLCESLALGERRFVAVIEFERRQFLVGGTGQSLVLLAKLEHAILDHAIKEQGANVREENR